MAEDQDKPKAEAEQQEAATGEAPPAMNRRQRRAAQATGSEDTRNRNERLRDASRQRRMQRSKERRAAVTRGLDASERVDDALSRTTQAVSAFLRNHFNVVQWVIVLGALGGIGYEIYNWRHGKAVETASDELMAGVMADLGRVGEPPPADEAGFDRTPTFPTEQARTKAATEEYKKVIAARGNAPLGTLAKMGLAGVRYDEAKYAEAATLYREVAASKLAKQDTDLKYRAVEGVGLSLESKGDTDGALKSYRELGNSDFVGFAGLGLYHQARLALAKGDKEGTKRLIESIKKKLGKVSDPDAQPFMYLRSAVQDLERAVDPAAAAAASTFSPAQLEALQKSMGNPAKLNELLRQMGLDPKNLGGGAPPPAPPAPAPGPTSDPGPSDPGPVSDPSP